MVLCISVPNEGMSGMRDRGLSTTVAHGSGQELRAEREHAGLFWTA